MPTISAALPLAAEQPVEERGEPDARWPTRPRDSGADPMKAEAPARAAPRSAGRAPRAGAGASADTNVTPVPTINETMMVRGSICSGPPGRSMPNAESNASSGFTIRRPSPRPSTDATTPTTSASSATEPTT